MTLPLGTHPLYEDNVLDQLAEHQIKQELFGAPLQVSALPTAVTGAATGGDSATVLIDSGATFQTDNVAVGDAIANITDGSVGVDPFLDQQISYRIGTSRSQCQVICFRSPFVTMPFDNNRDIGICH